MSSFICIYFPRSCPCPYSYLLSCTCLTNKFLKKYRILASSLKHFQNGPTNLGTFPLWPDQPYFNLKALQNWKCFSQPYQGLLTNEGNKYQIPMGSKMPRNQDLFLRYSNLFQASALQMIPKLPVSMVAICFNWAWWGDTVTISQHLPRLQMEASLQITFACVYCNCKQGLHFS